MSLLLDLGGGEKNFSGFGDCLGGGGGRIALGLEYLAGVKDDVLAIAITGTRVAQMGEGCLEGCELAETIFDEEVEAPIVSQV